MNKRKPPQDRLKRATIILRNAVPGDSEDFAELVLLSAPYFTILFGKKIKLVLQDMFCRYSNLFSLNHVFFAEINGDRAGMLLGYDWKTKREENLKTGLLLFKNLGFKILSKSPLLLRFNATVGKLDRGEYYISNIAVYPEYRCMGVGKSLMIKAEQKAKIADASRIVLDVEKENIQAITFYRKLGYKTIKEFSIPLQKHKTLEFLRMAKVLRG